MLHVYTVLMTAARPGIALYTVFGFLAGFSGWLLWSCFMGMSTVQLCRIHVLGND